MGSKLKGLMPVIIFYFVLNLFLVFTKESLKSWNVNGNVVAIGNTFLFFITLVSFGLAQRGLKNPNPHAFVRSVYLSVMIKLFACIIGAFLYISMYKSDLNKAALFICMGLYLVYTFLEISALTKMLKQKKNA